MADTRYFVYVTEPDDHYTSQSSAETRAAELSARDQDNTYLVRGAVIDTVANVSAAGVVTITPTPNARWDNHHVGWHFDETTGSRASVSLGSPICTNDLTDVNANVGYASGQFSSAAHLNDAGTDEILRASTLDFRFSGDWTWTGWVYKVAAWPSVADTDIISAVDDSDAADWGLFSDGAGATFFEFWDDTAGTVTVAKDMASTGTWYFISVVYTASTKVARCALDATSFTDSSALSNGLRQLSTRLDFVASDSANFYVDEHHFFTETKTDAEISEFFSNGSGRLYPYG